MVVRPGEWHRRWQLLALLTWAGAVALSQDDRERLEIDSARDRLGEELERVQEWSGPAAGWASNRPGSICAPQVGRWSNQPATGRGDHLSRGAAGRTEGVAEVTDCTCCWAARPTTTAPVGSWANPTQHWPSPVSSRHRATALDAPVPLLRGAAASTCTPSTSPTPTTCVAARPRLGRPPRPCPPTRLSSRALNYVGVTALRGEVGSTEPMTSRSPREEGCCSEA